MHFNDAVLFLSLQFLIFSIWPEEGRETREGTYPPQCHNYKIGLLGSKALILGNVRREILIGMTAILETALSIYRIC